MSNLLISAGALLLNSHELSDDLDNKEESADVLKGKDGVVLNWELESSEVHRHKARVCNDDKHQTVEVCNHLILRIDEEILLEASFSLLLFITLLCVVIIRYLWSTALLFLLLQVFLVLLLVLFGLHVFRPIYEKTFSSLLILFLLPQVFNIDGVAVSLLLRLMNPLCYFI